MNKEVMDKSSINPMRMVNARVKPELFKDVVVPADYKIELDLLEELIREMFKTEHLKQIVVEKALP